MSRAATLLFAIVAYAIFFATFLYLIVFVGDFSFRRAGRSMSARGAPVAVAAVVDVALIALFGLQHSVMARQGFKAAGPGSCRGRPSAASMSSPRASC